MKKLLILSAFFLPACVEQNYSSQHEKVNETNIETLVDTTYKHPEAKKVGDTMPSNLGEKVSYTFTYALNSMTGEVKESGLTIGYDMDGDKNTVEYEFVRRVCDFGIDEEIYAVYDVPNKLLYVSATRNNHIDLILEGVNSRRRFLTMIPTKCEENEAKKGLKA